MDINGYFALKQNEKDEIMRYKVRWFAKGFLQRPDIDNNETYSHAVDATTIQYFIRLAVYYEKCNYVCGVYYEKRH